MLLVNNVRTIYVGYVIPHLMIKIHAMNILEWIMIINCMKMFLTNEYFINSISNHIKFIYIYYLFLYIYYLYLN